MSSNSSKHKSPNKSKKSNSKSKKSSSGSSGSNGNGNTANATNNPNSTSQQLTIQANLNHLNNHDHASPNSTGRDKNSQKSYVGLSPKSIKCIWEQHDCSETELSADILPILAEDASYKLWEFANSLKTFTKHSGGKLTTDTVNEVLKDCNVPPIIGARAGNCEWNRLDFDGTYYFHDDEIINLREEYLRDISSIQCGPLALECNWFTNQRNYKDLSKLWRSIMLGIVMGNDAAYQYTIHTVQINPFIGCVLPYLLQKSVEYLAFGCSDDTIDRILKLLKAITQNNYCRDISANDTLFNLCSVIVCLLLGREDVKIKLEHIKRQQLKIDRLKKEDNLSVEKKSNAANGTVDDKSEFERFIKGENEAYNNSEEFSQIVVNPVAIGIKRETNNFNYSQSIKFEPNFYDVDFPADHMFDEQSTDLPHIKTEAKTSNENLNGFDNYTFNDATPSKAKTAASNEIFSPFEAEMCDDRFIDDLCESIGSLANKFGYFEFEIIYLMSKRLEIFFVGLKSWTTTEFKWLQRVIKALFALGDVAFRELIVYFDRIPFNGIPAWIQPDFNATAIFIRGRKDIYFYEYLQEICGDGLTPFITFYSKKIHSIHLKWSQNRTSCLTKIETKLKLSKRERKIESNKAKPTFDDLFPEKVERIIPQKKLTRKMGFKFAGCCPVPAKPKKNLSVVQKFEQSNELFERFNRKYVICKRKLLKPICVGAGPTIAHDLVDFRWYHV